MKIVLTEEEVRGALRQAVEERINSLVTFSQDNCYFNITDYSDEEIEMGSIEFVCCED